MEFMTRFALKIEIDLIFLYIYFKIFVRANELLSTKGCQQNILQWE